MAASYRARCLLDTSPALPGQAQALSLVLQPWPARPGTFVLVITASKGCEAEVTRSTRPAHRLSQNTPGTANTLNRRKFAFMAQSLCSREVTKSHIKQAQK
jgi:hypothetical protein